MNREEKKNATDCAAALQEDYKGVFPSILPQVRPIPPTELCDRPLFPRPTHSHPLGRSGGREPGVFMIVAHTLASTPPRT
jgi:hypothetical protein